ncbi:hypothetical protein NBRC116493_27860 [Aurantivibrio infirmus]
MQIKPVSRIVPAERHELTILQPSLLEQHFAWKASGRWKGHFNVAAWVRFPEGLVDSVHLMLTYRDEERRKSYQLDRCLPNRQTLILLNGGANIDVVGKVSEMSLYLNGLPEDAVWMVDECRMEPKQSASQEQIAKNKVAARNR